VLAIFLLGLFWKKTTSSAALAGALLTIPASTILKFLPRWTGGAFPDYPFLDRMTIIFVMIVAVMVVMSLVGKRSENNSARIEIDFKMMRVSPGFLIGSVLILGILTGLYASFW
jgi:SSS family solute:Na+ symporter